MYIFRVLKKVHPEVGISKTAMTTINSILLDVYRKIAKESSMLSQRTQRVKGQPGQTLSAKDVQTATKLVLPGELSKHAVSEAAQALIKYNISRQTAEA